MPTIVRPACAAYSLAPVSGGRRSELMMLLSVPSRMREGVQHSVSSVTLLHEQVGADWRHHTWVEHAAHKAPNPSSVLSD